MTRPQSSLVRGIKIEWIGWKPELFRLLFILSGRLNIGRCIWVFNRILIYMY